LELPHAVGEHHVKEPKRSDSPDSSKLAERVSTAPAIHTPSSNYHSSDNDFRELEASTTQDTQVFLPTTSRHEEHEPHASTLQPFEDADAERQASSTSSPSGDLEASSEPTAEALGMSSSLSTSAEPSSSAQTSHSVDSDDPSNPQALSDAGEAEMSTTQVTDAYSQDTQYAANKPGESQLSTTQSRNAYSQGSQYETHEPGYSEGAESTTTGPADLSFPSPPYTTTQFPPVLEEAGTSPMPAVLEEAGASPMPSPFPTGPPVPSTPKPAEPLNMKRVIGPAIAGVAGAAAIAGVVAVSVMKNKKEKAPNAQTIKGSLNLKVPDANTFLKDLTAERAVSAGIADAAGVKPEFVVLTVTMVPQSSRRLQLGQQLGEVKSMSIVKVSYKIILPSTSTGLTAAGVDQKLASKSAAEITQAVQSRLAVAKGPNYPVAVVTFQVGSHPVAVEMPTTSTLPPFVMQSAHATTPALMNSAVATATSRSNVAARAGLKSRITAHTSAMPGASAQAWTTPSPGVSFSNHSASSNRTMFSSLGNFGVAGNNSFWIGVGGICVAWALFACCVACVLCMRRKSQRPKKRPVKDPFMSSRSAGSFMSGSTEAEDSDPDEQPLMDKRVAPSASPSATPDVESQYLPVDYSSNPGFQYAQQAGPPVPTYAGAQSMPPNQAYGLPPGWQASPYANMPTQNNLLGMTLPATVF
jgi:hypothetical protein